jgi:hypothetical protein
MKVSIHDNFDKYGKSFQLKAMYLFLTDRQFTLSFLKDCNENLFAIDYLHFIFNEFLLQLKTDELELEYPIVDNIIKNLKLKLNEKSQLSIRDKIVEFDTMLKLNQLNLEDLEYVKTVLLKIAKREFLRKQIEQLQTSLNFLSFEQIYIISETLKIYAKDED